MSFFEETAEIIQATGQFAAPSTDADLSKQGAAKVMLIRHAEKPDGTGAVLGVDASGRPDPNQLSVRGWQRAGALVRFFAPNGEGRPEGIATPSAIFASNGTNSVRSFSTICPLATELGIPVNTIPKNDEAALLAAIRSSSGAVLICWSHEPLPSIARRIAGESSGVPAKWPGKRFDLVWILDRCGGGWCFSQIGQHLLPGDTFPAKDQSPKMETDARMPEGGMAPAVPGQESVPVFAGAPAAHPRQSVGAYRFIRTICDRIRA